MPKKYAKSKKHFRSWKEAQFADVKSMIENNPIVAIADINSLPASAANDFRKILKENGFSMRVTKSKLIQKALKEAKLDSVMPLIEGSIALVAGDGNPFRLYSTIKKNASTSSAKIGMIAPKDIVVPEGDTGIPPGPALSDFKAVNIQTQIKEGKIYVPKDYTVAKKGDTISSGVVSILAKLNIKPIKVLLNIKGALDKSEDILYSADVLDLDISAYKQNIMSAYNNSYLLAISQSYIAKETIVPLITKAVQNTKALAVSKDILNKDTAKAIVSKVHRQAKGLSSKVN